MTNAICGIDFKRRAATRDAWGARFRGLKPTATVTGSLRDRVGRVATPDGSRGFQPTDKWPQGRPRRVAAVEQAGLHQAAAVLAKKIQKNLEELL